MTDAPLPADPSGRAEAAEPAPEAMRRLRATISRLVSPGGCAWHGVQTHESLIPFLIEETAELVDAIERGLPADEVAGELGDVLYQVLFHAEIAAQAGEGYDFDRVAEMLNEKLIARHPHVFGDRGYMTVAELAEEWEHLKEDAAGARRGSRAPLEGIPAGMATLARAAKVIERLKRAHLLEIPAAEPGSPDAEAAEEAVGEELLAILIRANAAGIDADRALRASTRRLANALTDGDAAEPDLEE